MSALNPDWTCHICHKTRPDTFISVFKHRVRSKTTGVEFDENVRYCNDNRECVVAAPDFHFFDMDNYEVVS